jgi:hypothetical protein
MPYTIITPVPAQPISASLFGQAVKDAIDDLDARLSALEAFTTGKPTGKIAQTAGQTLNDNTDTAIQFPAADILDTHDFHNPSVNNTRITPNVPGQYQFTGVLYIAGATTFASRACWFRKNGTTALTPADRKGNMVNSVNASLSIGTIESFNGTSDYMEFIGFQDNTASAGIPTQVATQFATVVMWEFLRG